MELSSITEEFTESVIREMTRICDALGGNNLAQGMPDFETPKPIKQAAIEAIQHGYNQYPVTYGEPKLLEAIANKVANYNGIKCNPQTDITVTCGATEAMIATLMAVVNPGEEIILFEPFYENYGPDSILSGAEPRYVSLIPPNWSYSHDELAKAFNKKTKAIVINTPHNPTGKVFSRKELIEIANLCEKWDSLAITDEIYEHILYDGEQHISMASIDGMADRTVTINSISKTYSVTGWRVGWAIANKRITKRIRKVHDFLTIGAPTPFQKAATLALNMPQDYYDNLRCMYCELRDFLFGILSKVGFKPFLPKGAYYIIADASELMARLGVDDDFSFSRKFLELTGVATVPGSSFYVSHNKEYDQVRFSFCKTQETLQKVKKALGHL